MPRCLEMAESESGRIRRISMLAQSRDTAENIFEDWPASYYREDNPLKRREYLSEQLRRQPDSAGDQRRKALHETRFDCSEKEPADRFVRAWMMIRICENDHIGFFNRKGKEKELRQNLEALCILNHEMSDELIAEWRDFARKYLIICCESSSYRSVGFGLIHLNDEKSALKIAAEIDLVTRIIPSRFSLESECQRFRDTVIQVYCGLLENGTEYWEKYNR